MTTAPKHARDPDTAGTGHPGDVADTGTRGHIFALTSAADACNTSKRTLLRHADDLTRHGATKDTEGRWVIPYSALVACGFRPGEPRTADTGPPAHAHAPDDLAALRAELADTRHRAAIAETQRDAAIALAAERANHIDSLRIALRALWPAPHDGVLDAEQPLPRAVQVEPRGWWRRLIGSYDRDSTAQSSSMR